MTVYNPVCPLKTDRFFKLYGRNVLENDDASELIRLAGDAGKVLIRIRHGNDLIRVQFHCYIPPENRCILLYTNNRILSTYFRIFRHSKRKIRFSRRETEKTGFLYAVKSRVILRFLQNPGASVPAALPFHPRPHSPTLFLPILSGRCGRQYLPETRNTATVR